MKYVACARPIYDPSEEIETSVFVLSVGLEFDLSVVGVVAVLSCVVFVRIVLVPGGEVAS